MIRPVWLSSGARTNQSTTMSTTPIMSHRSRITPSHMQLPTTTPSTVTKSPTSLQMVLTHILTRRRTTPRPTRTTKTKPFSAMAMMTMTAIRTLLVFPKTTAMTMATTATMGTRETFYTATMIKMVLQRMAWQSAEERSASLQTMERLTEALRKERHTICGHGAEHPTVSRWRSMRRTTLSRISRRENCCNKVSHSRSGVSP